MTFPRTPNIYPEEQEPKHEPKLAPIATIIASLIGLLITIIASQRFGAFLPVKIFNFSVTILILAIVIFVFYISSSPTISWIQCLLIKRKQSKVILANYEDFRILINDFEEFANPSKDNIAKILYRLEIGKNEYGETINLSDKLLHDSIFYSFFDIYKVVLEKVDSQKWCINNFRFVAREFSTIVALYNRIISQSLEKITIADQGKIPNDSKINYKKLREKYVDYLKKYMEFCNRIDQKTGENIFKVYLDFPKEL